MKPRSITLIGAPTDVGAADRGASMGPEALRVAGLREALIARGLKVHDRGNLQGPINPMQPPDSGYRHLDEVTQWNRHVFEAVSDELDDGRLPIVLGGDHCLAIGSIGAVAAHCRRVGKRLRVLWLDAHADFNTSEITPSGNVHGMPVACLFGIGPKPLVVGCRLSVVGCRLSVVGSEARTPRPVGADSVGDLRCANKRTGRGDRDSHRTCRNLLTRVTYLKRGKGQGAGGTDHCMARPWRGPDPLPPDPCPALALFDARTSAPAGATGTLTAHRLLLPTSDNQQPTTRLGSPGCARESQPRQLPQKPPIAFPRSACERFAAGAR
jgi:hypothetical protein